MKFLEILFPKKKNTKQSIESTQLAIIKPESTTNNPNTVIVNGVKHFDIFQDGNGYFSAQHESGWWLMYKDYLSSTYQSAKKFASIKECQANCIYYINFKSIKKVGTIEFIPNNDDLWKVI